MQYFFCYKLEFSIRKEKNVKDTVAFLDVTKDVDGHILVVPKKHYKSILDCDNSTLHDVMDSVKLLSNHLIENCGYDGVNLLNGNDESAGQSVPHFHIYIILRNRNDGIEAWPKFTGAKLTLDEIYNKIVIK